jgi:hypothetical protein
MRTTGKFDSKGQEIFEGDKVIYAWGWFNWKGKLRTRYEIHTITVRKAPLMANGSKHDDGRGEIFCLGKAYNFWKGKEVQKVTKEFIKEIGMEEDSSFFFDDEDKAIKFTDQHFMGLSDEDWEKELEKREKEYAEYEKRKIDFVLKDMIEFLGWNKTKENE